MAYYSSTSEFMSVGLITWDWKEQPNWGHVIKAVELAQSFNAGVKIHEVDTGGDEYAIIISTDRFPKEDAERYYQNIDEFFNYEEV